MKTIGKVALVTLILAGAAIAAAGEASAACNPGSPQCLKFDPSGRLARVKNKLQTPGTLGSDETDCKSKLCGIDTGNGTSPGYLAARMHGGYQPVTRPDTQTNDPR